MVLRANFDPQFGRDIMIPIVFLFLGRYFGSVQAGDRIVVLLLIATLGDLPVRMVRARHILAVFRRAQILRRARFGDGMDTELLPGLYVSGTRTDRARCCRFSAITVPRAISRTGVDRKFRRCRLRLGSAARLSEALDFYPQDADRSDDPGAGRRAVRFLSLLRHARRCTWRRPVASDHAVHGAVPGRHRR